MSEVSKENPQSVQRLIDWNADVLLRLLKQVIAKRDVTGKGGWDDDPELSLKSNIVDEVKEIIELPDFCAETATPKPVDVPDLVKQQLKEYVTAIAAAHRNNPYHCLQHASHVAMAVTKLISRIAVSDFEREHPEYADSNDPKVAALLASHLHNQTYGIVSDPLTQFGVVLSALIHAVDHRGISNEDLVRVDPELAGQYKGTSLTEQLSVDKAWKKLMEPQFENLRRCIYADAEEKQRLRQVMVNSVLATDIEDEERQDFRQTRWDMSFGPGASIEEDMNRKATCVIETLMQAADEFHTMQHWHVYVKWNERAFEEATKAYKEGRITSAPAKTWYKNELAHFDNFVIPLTMQLKDIDAFVVCSDEYLNYALRNRQRWASNGREIVAALVAKYTTGSASAKTDLIKAISKEGRDVEASALDAAAARHLNRLVDWNVEVFDRLIKQILAKRAASGKVTGADIPPLFGVEGKTIVDEIAEVVELPEFDAGSSPDKLKPNSVKMSAAAASQLREYLNHISSKFKNHPFHCLDHGSQVSMSAKKLLGRLILQASEAAPAEAHKQTFGLGSDPLTQLALVFAALIHDVDHSGVPNSQVALEGGELAKKYKRCMAEQNSFDLAWNQLMQPEFEDLRAAICADEDELKRFRQVLINAVLATDYSDTDLLATRKKRAEQLKESTDLNLKATATMVVLLQAADAFHTISHWQMYQKWNERSFFERYAAYESGRVKDDPSIIHYQNELRYLDEHVIPLCKEMQSLGGFGPSADECLAFATTNRDLWSARGEELSKTMVAKHQGKEDKKSREQRIAQRQSLSGHF
mmetsp:Transcript_102428/g.153524  ORF Transcript_102428/g.153524 Transcript_102428/m.153524 type:complete len:813 (+) Transcript_102428:86-2524(+)